MVCPPIDGLKGPWSVSRRGLEPRRFFGDPAPLARNNIIHITKFIPMQSDMQVCDFLSNGAERFWLEEQQVPYAVHKDQWVGYDDEKSIGLKVSLKSVHSKSYTDSI